MEQKLPLSSLSAFLQGTGAQLQPFDIGRRVVPLSMETFLGFEQTEFAYPFPLQRQAWFALLLQHPPDAHLIWFLRFPLDEQGKLVQAARDDFMQRLLERLGDNLSGAEQDGRMQAALQDNPYSFKPTDDRMAVLHARAALLTGAGASRFYQHARDYFAGRLGWDQWPFVGYQGIADVAVRLGEAGNERLLASAIPQLPLRPFEALCQCLENMTIGRELADAVIARAQDALRQPADTALLAAAIRALAMAEDRTASQRLIGQVLADACSTDPGILGAIAARAWECLAQAPQAAAFLERLADNSEGQQMFDQCLSDLLFLPGMREPLLNALRSPKHSRSLAQSIGAFFESVAGSGAIP